jgi:Mn2+/Fe2+ NRAMP family transporter
LATDVTTAAPSRRDLAKRALAIGPGLVFILAAVGPRDLISNSIAGAANGYSLLWLLVVALAARYVCLDASARYVMVSGESLLTGFGRCGRWVVWLWFVVAVLKRFVALLVKITLLGTAAHFVIPLSTPNSVIIWGLASWVGGFAMMYWGRYRLVERFSKLLALLMGASLAAAAVLSKPDLGNLVAGALTPSLPSDQAYYSPILVVMAVMSAASGSFGNLTYSAYVHETGWRKLSFLRTQRIDLLLSMGGMFLMLAMIQIAAAAALQPRGIQVSELENLIPIFAQVLGDGGRIVLGVSLWSITFSSYLGGGTGYALMFSDVYHRFVRPSDVIAEQDHGAGASYLPAYCWVVLFTFVSPLYFFFFMDWTPVWLLLVLSAASVLALPIVVLAVLRLTADKKIMGAYANGWFTNAVLAITAATALYLAWRSIIELFTSA